MTASFFHFYLLPTCWILFVIGAIGTFLNRRNLLIIIICIEVILLSVNLSFLTTSVSRDDLNGLLMSLLILTAAAAETALGLALCVLYYRERSTVDVELIRLIKGLLGFASVLVLSLPRPLKKKFSFF